MNVQEAQEILKAWNAMLIFYRQTPLTMPQSQALVLSVLGEYSLQQITTAIALRCKEPKEFPPTAGEVKAIIDRQNGGTGEQSATLKAEQVLRELDAKANSADDWIIADKKAAATIQSVFSSPQAFSKSSFDDFTKERKRNEFIKKYILFTEQEITNAPQHFGGIYADSDDPLVTFLGDYQECLKVANEFYQGKHPRYKPDPKTIKALPKPKEGKPATKEQVEDYLKRINDCFNQMFVKRTV